MASIWPAKAEGSCIFLHVWPGPTKGTVGCIATSEATMAQLMQIIKASQKPSLVVQLKPLLAKINSLAFGPVLSAGGDA